jgi:Fe-S-cluster-containing hydrogenase component 2
MRKKLLINLTRLREYKDVPIEGVVKEGDYAATCKTIRELASFQFACRKCEKAPCIAACPANALEKDGQGIIRRALNRCVRCKSCIVICPFGTMMDNLFAVKTSGRRFINLENENSLYEFARSFPEDVAEVVEGDENPADDIYRLNENILIKEHIWQ